MSADAPKRPLLARWGAALALAAALLWALTSDLPAYVKFIVGLVAVKLAGAQIQHYLNALVDDVRATDEYLEFVMRGVKRRVRYEDVMLVCEGGYPHSILPRGPEQWESIEYATLYLRRANPMRAWEKICFELPARLVESGAHPTMAQLRQRVADAKRRAAGASRDRP